MTQESNDWLNEQNRSRNTRIITLTEGDVLVMDDNYYHVAEGEVSIYANGTIDEKFGSLAEVSQEAVVSAMAQKKTIFNMNDIKK